MNDEQLRSIPKTLDYSNFLQDLLKTRRNTTYGLCRSVLDEVVKRQAFGGYFGEYADIKLRIKNIPQWEIATWRNGMTTAGAFTGECPWRVAYVSNEICNGEHYVNIILETKTMLERLVR